MFDQLDKIQTIKALDETAQISAVAKWNSIAKPLRGLGLLEDAVIKIAGITGTAQISIKNKVVLVLCADHGVVAQGVSQVGQEITTLVAEAMTKNTSCVCHMAKILGASVVAVDIGCASPVPGLPFSGTIRGTNDMTKTSAMTLDDVKCAISTGIRLVQTQKNKGVDLIATGEMGIGNTTASTAVLCVLLGKNPELMTGRGAGLSSEGVARKKQAIAQALALHKPNSSHVMEVLATVGGLEIAGLCGVFLGGAIYRVPVVIDGLISVTAALCANRLNPLAVDYMLPSHQSAEPACKLALEELGLTPIIHGEMALGEGTGAVAFMSLLDMALSVYENMSSFSDIGMDAYEPKE